MGTAPQSPPAPAQADSLPSPPSYEDAIQRPLNDLSTPHTSGLPLHTTKGLNPTNFDPDHDGLQGADADDRDLEDELDYEESRPLKMGKVPDARAQYTFIQPHDTIAGYNKGKGKKKNSNVSQQQIVNPTRERHYHEYGQSYSQPQNHHLQGSGYSIPVAASSSASSAASPFMASAPLDYSHHQNAEADKAYAPPAGPPPPSRPSHGASPPTPYTPSPVPFAGISPAAPGGLINPQDISIASYKRTKKGAESVDPVLGDPYQLYRFFVAHNDRPVLNLVIIGHHIEKKETTERDSHGHHKVKTEDVRVEDFRVEYDLTKYIAPRGTLYTVPDPKKVDAYEKLQQENPSAAAVTPPPLAPTLKEVMEEYAEEENPFKEIHLVKCVPWEYEELTRALTHAIRSVGYRYTIDIDYQFTNNKVIVKSASQAATLMRNPWTQVFCALTLIGAIFYPARYCYRKVTDKTLKSEFEMTISTRDFYNMHYWSVVDHVQYK